MNYKIVNDEIELLKFIDILPDLADNEKFYCVLFSRKKYGDEFTVAPSGQLVRFLSDKDRLLNKIKQLEIKKGEYMLKGSIVDEKSLALYITPNPRNLLKATYDGIIGLTKLLKDDKKNINPHGEIMTCIQKSIGTKAYIAFDLDYKPLDFEKLDHIINADAIRIIETRGGYHLLVKLDKVAEKFKHTFYKRVMDLNADKAGDLLLPVPGCIQGGFTPRILK